MPGNDLRDASHDQSGALNAQVGKSEYSEALNSDIRLPTSNARLRVPDSLEIPNCSLTLNTLVRQQLSSNGACDLWLKAVVCRVFTSVELMSEIGKRTKALVRPGALSLTWAALFTASDNLFRGQLHSLRKTLFHPQLIA